MANNSIVKKAIQIDTGNAVRTVKSLKQEISDLRDALLNLEQGTEEYNEVQQQLTEDVEDLNTVMSAHKDKAEVLEGSYQDLQNQLKELKKAWKETNDEAERNTLGEQINNLNNQLKEMDASIGDFHRNVGNYQSAWKGLTSVMDNGEKMTDDLEKGIKAFGSALGLSKDQVNLLSDALKRMKDGFKIAKDITATKQATDGLAGSQKAAATTATAMATAENTASVATKGLSVSLKGLKAALISTGIGALIVALGALASALEKAYSKAREARIEAINQGMVDSAKETTRMTEIIKAESDTLEFERRKMEAAGATQKELLQQRIKDINKLIAEQTEITEAAWKKYNDEMARVSQLSKKKQEEQKAGLEGLETAANHATEALMDLNKELVSAKQDLIIHNIQEQHKATEDTVEALKKWSDVVTDPKFREAWTALFGGETQEGKSPSDVLREQYKEALKLAEAWGMETTEIDAFFQSAISESEDMWKSIQDMEKQIYDSTLSSAERLEQEKQKWIEIYKKWGMDATNLVKYYNDQITNAEEQAEKERLEEAQRKLDEYMDMVDGTLEVNEKLASLFDPTGQTKTAAGDIQQEIDNLQRLYDTQMNYLNGLLESADLTEEAYAGIEERILELTRTFGAQMDTLKKEQEYQGKNFGFLSRKYVQNISLMDQAAADFSSAAADRWGEDSVAFKGFATAQALISAFLAANRVLAEEPGGIVAKSIAAAAAVAAGLANVYAIWSVAPDGSNAGSVSAPDLTATPVIGNSQPIQYVSNVTNADLEDELNRPIWVSVQDISSGLDRQANVVDATSF